MNDYFKTNTPWLSITIPVYNAERYLSECIISILQQTFRDFEVILVDDGSTDRSLDIALSLAREDQRIKVFTKSNEGSLHTRCYAAERVSGEYILFADADDYYVAGAFEYLYNLAKFNEFELIQFNTYRRFKHIRLKRYKHYKELIVGADEFKYIHYPKLLCSYYEPSCLDVSVWSKLYHRRLLENLPSNDLRDRVFMEEDVIFNLHLLRNCKSALFIDKALYVYREISGGTNKFRKNEVHDIDCVKKRQLAFLHKWDGADYIRVEKNLHYELVGWFFYCIKQSILHLDKDEVVQLINSAYQYSSFIISKKYYDEHEADQSMIVRLFRQADPDAYIRAAYHDILNESYKCKLYKYVKQIIRKYL